MYTPRSNIQVCRSIISLPSRSAHKDLNTYVTSQQRASTEMKEFCKEHACSTTADFPLKRVSKDSSENSLKCTNHLRARKHLLLKALVFARCLINHLVTMNILQENSAKFQINVYKTWSHLKTKSCLCLFTEPKEGEKIFLPLTLFKNFFDENKKKPDYSLTVETLLLDHWALLINFSKLAYEQGFEYCL